MVKINCWEFKKCGRQPMGEKVHEMGACPAATETRTNGVNEGTNGGRACWCISGTMCRGTRQGTFAAKEGNCINCDFYIFVRGEQGSEYQGTGEIIKKIKT